MSETSSHDRASSSGASNKAKQHNLHMKFLQAQQPDLQLQYLTIQAFWMKMKEELIGINTDKVDPTKQAIPIEFVANEMKNEFVGSADKLKMVAGLDASAAMAKAAELFILELTLRSWQGINDGDRHNLTVEDIRKVIESTDTYDLFVDSLIPHSRNN